MNKRSNLSASEREPSEGKPDSGLNTWSALMGTVLILVGVRYAVTFNHYLDQYLKAPHCVPFGGLALGCFAAIISLYVGLCLLIPYNLYRKPALRALGLPALLISIAASVIGVCLTVIFALLATLLLFGFRPLSQEPSMREDVWVDIIGFVIIAGQSAVVLLLSAPATLLLSRKIRPSRASLILGSIVACLLGGVLIYVCWTMGMD